MNITVRPKTIPVFYWSTSGSNKVLANLVDSERTFFFIDPQVIANLGGNKTSSFSASQIDSNFKFTTSSDVTAITSNFAISNWIANNWTFSPPGKLANELSNFINNNFTNSTINPNSDDMVLVLTIGQIDSDFVCIPFVFFGNRADIDAFTVLLNEFDESLVDISSTGAAMSIYSPNNIISYEASSKIPFKSSLKFGDSNGGVIIAQQNPAFIIGTQDFTIDMWLKKASNTAMGLLYSGSSYPNGNFDWGLLTASNYSFVFNYKAGPAQYSVGCGAGAGISDSDWHHVAVVRASNAMYFFVDGNPLTVDFSFNENGPHGAIVPDNLQSNIVSQSLGNNYDLRFGSTAENANIDDPAPQVPNPGAYQFRGNLDELRFSVGIARWTSAFTPPKFPY